MSLAKQNWFRKFRYSIKKMLPSSVAEKLVESNEKLKDKALRHQYKQNGFYSSEIKSPDRFLDYLRTQPESIKEDELRIVSSLAAEDKNHIFYDALLRSFLPELKYDSAEFIGNGIGGSSLNAFRKIKIGEELLFEKVYFSNHRDLQAVLWVDQLPENSIRIPKIKNVLEGDFLTAVYFEYFELIPLENTSAEKELIRLSKELISLSFAENFLSDGDISKELTAFDCHFEFKRNELEARRTLKTRDIDFNKLKNKAESSFRVLTHGDLQPTNIFQSSTLVDWDSSGVFPVGMDVAYLFFCLYVKVNINAEVSQWLDTHYKDFFSEEDWTDFERNFYFFLYVFSALFFAKGQAVSIEKQILKYLRHHDLLGL